MLLASSLHPNQERRSRFIRSESRGGEVESPPPPRSLLRAAHAGVRMAFIVVLVVGLSPAATVSVRASRRKIGENDVFNLLLGDDRVILGFRLRQRLRDGGDDGGVESLREDDAELDDETALLVRSLVDWHSLVHDALDISRRDYFSGSADESELTAVEMADAELVAAEGLLQTQLVLHVKVVAVALEESVLFLLEDDDDVARDDIGCLISLAAENDLLAVTHASVDVHLENLFLLSDLRSVALDASIFLTNDLSLAAAIRARLLKLLNHTRGDLSERHFDTLSSAALALLDSVGTLRSLAVAVSAKHVLVLSQFAGLSLVELLEGDLVRVCEILAFPLLGSSSSASTTSKEAATKELRENILSRKSTTTSFLQSLLSILVVDLTLVCIGEDLVCMADLLELLQSLWVVGILVWVVLHSHLTILLTNIILRGITGDSQQIIEFVVLGHVDKLALLKGGRL